MDICGMLVLILTVAPLTGFPALSLRATVIVSFPCFGGVGSKESVMVKSPLEDTGVPELPLAPDLAEQAASTRRAAAIMSKLRIFFIPFTMDRPRRGARPRWLRRIVLVLG